MTESVALPAKRSAAAVTTLVKRTLRLAGVEALRVRTVDCVNSADPSTRIWSVCITTTDADALVILAAAGFGISERAADDLATMGFFSVTAAIA